MKEKNFRIRMDRQWSLEDFYKFGRAFEQVYYFACSAMSQPTGYDSERADYAYAVHPWQGGFSTVNFFNNLRSAVPKDYHPAIVSIQYASPGWIELYLWSFAGKSVAALVGAVADSVGRVNSAYHEIMKGLEERKLLRIETKQKELSLAREELAYIEDCAATMSRLLGFKSVEDIHNLTPNPYISLKVLLSVYRRVRTLADYTEKGKAKFPE